MRCSNFGVRLADATAGPRMKLGANGKCFVRQQDERSFGGLHELKELVVLRKLQLGHSIDKPVEIHRDPMDFLVQVRCLLRSQVAARHGTPM